MSRIKTFHGSATLETRDAGYLVAFAFGNDGLPEFGVVRVPLHCFGRRDREAILASPIKNERGGYITVALLGRVCPRSIRVRIRGSK